jgi:hypothetical protein
MENIEQNTYNFYNEDGSIKKFDEILERFSESEESSLKIPQAILVQELEDMRRIQESMVVEQDYLDTKMN